MGIREKGSDYVVSATYLCAEGLIDIGTQTAETTSSEPFSRIPLYKSLINNTRIITAISLCLSLSNQPTLLYLSILAWTKCRLVTKHVFSYLLLIYTFMCMIIFLRILILSFKSHQTRILHSRRGFGNDEVSVWTVLHYAHLWSRQIS